MSPSITHIFTTDEAATAYAITAERILGDDSSFLERNPAVVAVFVSLLFQSLEISIKHVGIHSCLFTEPEVRSRNMRAGHGIREIALLAVERLSGQPFDPLVQALTYFHTECNAAEMIRLMIHGAQFERTRESYATRRLGYGQVAAGDFAVVTDLPGWVAAVKQTAQNLPKIVCLISQWRVSPAKSGPFAVWLDTGLKVTELI